MSAVANIPKCITARLQEIENERRVAKSRIETAQIAEDASDVFGRLGVPSSVHCLSHIVIMYLTVVGDFQQFIAPILRHFRAAGYKVVRRREEGQSGGGGIIDFDLGRNGKPELSVFSTIHPSNGASCRYVQTGTKEVPLYELRCGQ